MLARVCCKCVNTSFCWIDIYAIDILFLGVIENIES